MKLPGNVFIDPQKLIKYLLVRKAKDDKSKFLAQAGYTLETWKQLEADLFNIVSHNEAFYSYTSKFGDYYEIKAIVKGPNGKIVNIRTMWMKEHFSDKIKFITLFPDKEK